MIVENFLAVLNNNKIMWGVTMLLLNLGGKYIVADLGKFQEKMLANEYFKKVILFSLFFVATRDILIAFLLTVLYTLIVNGILHEKQKFSIVPNKYKEAYINDHKVDAYLQNIKILNKNKDETFTKR
jgi:uncharacterized membrane protein (DUF485 family)